tara:strand:+ start:42 stop:860 length:819 start_codon:yes stop_codon:yes gene_type:complete
VKALNFFLLFFFLFVFNSYSLPKCEGNDPTKWNNCKGTSSEIRNAFKPESINADWECFFGKMHHWEYKDSDYISLCSPVVIKGRTTYKGEWSNGKPQGLGSEYAEGRVHPVNANLGSCIYETIDVISTYVGDWNDGEYNGNGRYETKWIKTIGAVSKENAGQFWDIMNGTGYGGRYIDPKKRKYIENDLNRIKLHLKRCKEVRFDTKVRIDKFIYDGSWKNGNFHGQGTWIYNCTKFKGDWNYGELTKGLMVKCDGSKKQVPYSRPLSSLLK